MKKIFVCAVFLLLGNSSNLICQLKIELKTEALAYIQSGLMEFSDTESDEINIEEINFQSERLLSVLLAQSFNNSESLFNFF